ncbi:hypothetical protein K505DRAFT_361536 [Melanomma pulvis-pyrius CBS 109.77]|uniref:BTB domain-containing protein n=1 Tax=Melanomma pulvis-pyrius CBS 109.77 TaxID=1314802 RepID=A0A6A6XCF5_9PLEO|nr:hypothetical protein K505DRAFT_361536 [Melanomma pulvis-pyrius CBS 109.77]
MSNPPEKQREQLDMFLEMIQGPAIQVVIGTTTTDFSPSVYWLPKAILNVHSAFFRQQIPIANDNHIIIPDTTPGIFGLFLKFIYQGSYPTRKDNDAYYAGDKIPPSARAWILGDKLGAKSFMNHAIVHVYQSLGKIFFITPELIEWCMENTTATSQLRQLLVDTLIVHWSKNTKVVAKSDVLNEYWNRIFDVYTDLRKEFIFGLKGELRLGNMHSYFTFEKPGAAPEPEVQISTEKISPPPKSGSAVKAEE